MTTVTPFRAAREAPKAKRSTMQTLIFKVAEIGAWRVPPFQRPVRVNGKVQALALEIQGGGGVIPGVITLGTVAGDSATYIVDGQHRLEAFRISGLAECIGDFRLCQFESMGEMAQEFVDLNSALVKMRPDDILRGLESSNRALRRLRQDCPFIGYDMIRRGAASPMLGMSLTLRCWNGSATETPTSAGMSATQIAESLTDDAVSDLVEFLGIAHAAWGRDPEYARLWGALNLAVCMWMFRRLVKDRVRVGNQRYVVLSAKQFSACLMALSANGGYVDWLQGRALGDRDRGPCYTRIRKIFADRLTADGMTRVQFPQPSWSRG